MNVTFLDENAVLPYRATTHSAGYDLCSCEDISIFESGVVRTGISVEIPPHCYGHISPRSSLAMKGIAIGGGVIDSDYRGEIKVILFNFSEDPFHVTKGQRIAQLILTNITTLPIIHNGVEIEEKFVTRVGGFGSTN
jgi:dUTP pyrophosphatase